MLWGAFKPVRPDDEGDLFMAVTVKDDVLLVDFGKAVTWIGMDKSTAEGFIALLQKYVSTMQ